MALTNTELLAMYAYMALMLTLMGMGARWLERRQPAAPATPVNRKRVYQYIPLPPPPANRKRTKEER